MVEIYSPNITVDTIIINHFAYYSIHPFLKLPASPSSFIASDECTHWQGISRAQVWSAMHPLGDVKDETASHRAEHVKHMTRHM